MTIKRMTTWQKATALVPLALLSGAWTASLAVSSATAADSEDAQKLPDGTTMPTETVEDPANITAPGEIAPGVPKGSEDEVIKSASTNGIPAAALSAYQRAAQVIGTADPSCKLEWPLVAAIGRVESDHGRYGGNVLSAEGVSRPGIFGIPLDGSNGTQRISDTDAGQYDNDKTFDRAVGPMQFIPSTWSVVGVDGDGDGKRNPQDLDDAALATAVYLCSGDENLSTRTGRRPRSTATTTATTTSASSCRSWRPTPPATTAPSRRARRARPPSPRRTATRCSATAPRATGRRRAAATAAATARPPAPTATATCRAPAPGRASSPRARSPRASRSRRAPGPPAPPTRRHRRRHRQGRRGHRRRGPHHGEPGSQPLHERAAGAVRIRSAGGREQVRRQSLGDDARGGAGRGRWHRGRPVRAGRRPRRRTRPRLTPTSRPVFAEISAPVRCSRTETARRPEGRALVRGFRRRVSEEPDEQRGGLGGPVGEDDVGAGPSDAGERLQDRRLPVDPAAGGGGLDHGVLAGDVVGRDRHVDRVPASRSTSR